MVKTSEKKKQMVDTQQTFIDLICVDLENNIDSWDLEDCDEAGGLAEKDGVRVNIQIGPTVKSDDIEVFLPNDNEVELTATQRQALARIMRDVCAVGDDQDNIKEMQDFINKYSDPRDIVRRRKEQKTQE